MKNILKKGFALAVTAVLGLSMAACGNTDTVKDNQTDNKNNNNNVTASEYVYVPEFVSLESEEEHTYLNNPTLAEDRLYYTRQEYAESVDETTGETVYEQSTYLCYREYANPSVEEAVELEFVVEGYEAYMNRHFFDKEGNLYVLWNVYPIMVEGNEYDYSDQTFYMVKYDSSMTEIARRDIGEAFTDQNNTYIQYTAIGADGKIYASSNNLIYVFNNDCTFDKAIETNADWINSMFGTDDGRIFYSQYGMNGMETVEIDTATGKAGATYANLLDSNGTIKSGSEGKLLVCGSSKLYEYDLATQESTVVLEWLDCNIDGNYIQDFAFMEDGRIVVYYDNYEDEPELTFLTKTEASKVTQKKVITLATLYEGNSNLQRAAVKFNKTNDEYQIKLKNYIDNTAEWTETTYSDAITRLNADITSDNCPDIIDLSNLDTGNLAGKGALEDLTPYLEASTVANKSDFVESVLKAYQMDGKQVTVPKSFSMATLMGKSRFVGNEPGWTLDDVIALADAYPDAKLLHNVTKESALQICLMYNSDSFIDYETGNCNFDSPEFIKVLEFASRFQDDYEYDPDGESFPSQIQSDKVLLADTSFYSVQEYQMYRLMMEEEATCIGYPTFDGSAGVFIQGSDMYGISSKSANKDGAWKFLESILAENENEHSWQFPTRIKDLDAMFEDAMTPQYQYDENGQIMYDENGNELQYPKTSWGYDDWDADIYAATQEEVDEIKAMIDMAQPIGNSDQTIFSMIMEDAAFYFAGQKSAEEVAKVIQSRVEIYVSVNS